MPIQPGCSDPVPPLSMPRCPFPPLGPQWMECRVVAVLATLKDQGCDRCRPSSEGTERGLDRRRGGRAGSGRISPVVQAPPRGRAVYWPRQHGGPTRTRGVHHVRPVEELHLRCLSRILLHLRLPDRREGAAQGLRLRPELQLRGLRPSQGAGRVRASEGCPAAMPAAGAEAGKGAGVGRLLGRVAMPRQPHAAGQPSSAAPPGVPLVRWGSHLPAQLPHPQSAHHG
jgi:hypothetical protein